MPAAAGQIFSRRFACGAVAKRKRTVLDAARPKHTKDGSVVQDFRDRLEAAYDAWGESGGTTPAQFFELMDEAIEFHSVLEREFPSDAVSGPFCGKAAVIGYWTAIAESWEMLSSRTEAVVGEGDRIVWIGRVRWRHNGQWLFGAMFRYRQLWKTYETKHQRMSQEDQHTFEQLFGPNFIKAFGEIVGESYHAESDAGHEPAPRRPKTRGGRDDSGETGA